MTGKENHQGVVAYMAPMKLWEAEELIQMLPKAPEPAMVILCDHLQDPHNLGAVIRSAEAAGASAVLIPKRGGVLPTGTVVKTSAGAALRLPVAKTGNISQTIRLLQEANFWVVGLSMDAEETLFKEDMPPRLTIVIGAEGAGLGQAVAKSCDELRYIPMAGKTGSLNASVAAALALEYTRSSRNASRGADLATCDDPSPQRIDIRLGSEHHNLRCHHPRSAPIAIYVNIVKIKRILRCYHSL